MKGNTRTYGLRKRGWSSRTSKWQGLCDNSFFLGRPWKKYNRLILYYQLSWWNKLATVKSFKVDISSISPLSELWQWNYAQNVSFETLYGGQFTLSSWLIILNCPVILCHQCSTTVSLETNPLNSMKKYFDWSNISSRI